MKDILISDVVCATNGKVDTKSSNTDDYISNITTSSKDVQRGSLFIAIRGGHNFVQEAIDKGAVCCLLEKEVDVKAEGVTLIYVEDTVKAMMECRMEVTWKRGCRTEVTWERGIGKTGM